MKKEKSEFKEWLRVNGIDTKILSVELEEKIADWWIKTLTK